MPPRSLVAVSATLVVLGASLTAAASPAVPPLKRPPATAHAAGVVAGWDAGASVIAIVDPDVWGAPKAVRRAVRAGAGVEVTIGRRTRIIGEDPDGVRAPMSAAELFDRLDDGGLESDVEAFGRVAKGAVPGPDRMVDVTATRLIVHLPPPEDGDWGDGGDPGDGGGFGDEPGDPDLPEN